MVKWNCCKWKILCSNPPNLPIHHGLGLVDVAKTSLSRMFADPSIFVPMFFTSGSTFLRYPKLREQQSMNLDTPALKLKTTTSILLVAVTSHC